MKKYEYLKLVKKYSPREEALKNALMAFLSGGIIGVFSTFIYEMLLKTNMSSNDASSWTLLLIIFLASISTGLGYFDKLVEKFKCGIIVPISGFAHSMTSATIDGKKEGLISGIGSSMFKLAGSVILYGVFASFILVIVKVIING